MKCKEKIENAYDFKSCILNIEDSKAGGSGDMAKSICDIPSTSSCESSSKLTICQLCKNSVSIISVISVEKLLKDDSVMEIFQSHMPEVVRFLLISCQQ